MAVSTEVREPPPARRAVWNDPRARALIVQAVVLVAVILLGLYLVNNTLDNMKARGIASGFSFLDKTAGFSIATHLIDYEEANTYGRAFVVGLLNTLLVSAIGIVLATALGFTIGVARLSSNWLVAKLAAVYIEVLRNIPLLLQLFFWYFAVLRNLPTAKNSVEILGAAFINKRGLFMPSPILEPGFGWIGIALAVALAGVIVGGGVGTPPSRAYRPTVRHGLGRDRDSDRPAILGGLRGGSVSRCRGRFPALQGFNFQRRHHADPRTRLAHPGALDLYRRLHRRGGARPASSR